MIQAICVVQDESKCLDIPIRDFLLFGSILHFYLDFYLGMSRYCVCCLSVGTKQGNDIHDFCCCHLWCLVGEHCRKPRIVFHNTIFENDYSYKYEIKCCVVWWVVCCVVWCVAWWWCCLLCGVWVFYFSFSLNSLLSLSRSLSFFLVVSFFCLVFVFLFSLFPSRQQTQCKALINKRDVQLWGVCMWSGARQVHSISFSVHNITPSSSPLPPPFSSPSNAQKKVGNFLLHEYFREVIILHYSCFSQFRKNDDGWNYRHHSFILIRKQSNCNASNL